MKVLITGGAGYIGSALVPVLAAQPEVSEVIVYDNFSRENYNLLLGQQKLPANKIKIVRADLLDSRKMQLAVKTADVVVNLAAMVTTPFANHNPHQFDQNNNWATAELVYAADNSNVAKFIHASSTSVYGASNKPIDLNARLNPSTFYGISKLKAEEHISTFSRSNIETYLLRFSNVYGYNPSMRFDSVINKFMFEANFYNKLRIYGNGEQVRTFIEVHRLAEVLKNIVLGKHKPGTYNLTESSYSINEIAEIVSELYPNLERTYVNQNMRMRSLQVTPSEAFPELEKSKNLANDLKLFKTQFSF